ncbi:MAG: GNAT family N-acetyltransferase [Candidatus Alcyoniella australis]|nr:GNAT family N-acetyltransferase [Candidatus Alcyoniella australis]
MIGNGDAMPGRRETVNNVSTLLKALINRTGVIEVETEAGIYLVEVARHDPTEAFLKKRGQEHTLGISQAVEAGRAFMATDPQGSTRALISLLARREDEDGHAGLLILEQELHQSVPRAVESALLDRIIAVRHNYIRIHTYWVLEDRRDIYQARGFHQIEELMRYQCRPGAPLPEVRAAVVRDTDADDIKPLQCIDEAAFDQMWRNDPSVMAAWVNRRNSYRTRVVEYEGSPAGFSTFRHVPELRCGYYIRTAVEPALQGRGLGRALLADAIGWFGKQQTEVVELTTQVWNSVSRRLYEEFGFESKERLAVLVLDRAAPSEQEAE